MIFCKYGLSKLWFCINIIRCSWWKYWYSFWSNFAEHILQQKLKCSDNSLKVLWLHQTFDFKSMLWFERGRRNKCLFSQLWKTNERKAKLFKYFKISPNYQWVWGSIWMSSPKQWKWSCSAINLAWKLSVIL